MSDFFLNVFNYFLDNTLEVLSFVATIAGFAIVIIDTKKTKRQIKKARKEIFKNNASNDLTNVINRLEEIKRNHRSIHNVGLVDLYSNLRQLIISIKTMHPDLEDKQKIILQRSLQFTIDMEKTIETCIRENPNFQISPDEISTLSRHIDKLYELSLELRIREEK